MYSRDWRQALQTPPTYRLGNRIFRFNCHIALLISFLGSFIVLYFYVKPWLTKMNNNKIVTETNKSLYNYTYPLTVPIATRGVITYRISIVADLDTNSKSKIENSTWSSFCMKGFLLYNPAKESITLNWDTSPPSELLSSFSLKDRGMELSELVVFNGKLFTFDDRTGIVYEMQKDNVIPWVLLTDGDGRINKGFKSEWATVKDEYMYVGSMGKEWTTNQGDFQNEFPMFVKVISTTGEIEHVNWSANYKRIRESIGIKWPGYMIHESVMWSHKNKLWYFLPRKCSHEKYNETKDEYMGCNYLITANESFNNLKSIIIGKRNPTYGYSSFKFIPNTDDKIIIALMTEEVSGRTNTYITAFKNTGEKILTEQAIPTSFKYEGLEFT